MAGLGTHNVVARVISARELLVIRPVLIFRRSLEEAAHSVHVDLGRRGQRGRRRLPVASTFAKWFQK